MDPKPNVLCEYPHNALTWTVVRLEHVGHAAGILTVPQFTLAREHQSWPRRAKQKRLKDLCMRIALRFDLLLCRRVSEYQYCWNHLVQVAPSRSSGLALTMMVAAEVMAETRFRTRCCASGEGLDLLLFCEGDTA